MVFLTRRGDTFTHKRTWCQISRLSGQKCGNTAPKTIKFSHFGHKLAPQGRLVCTIFRTFSAFIRVYRSLLNFGGAKMGRTSSITMPSMVGIMCHAPAVDQKVWCFFVICLSVSLFFEHLYSAQVVAKKIKNTNNNLNKQTQCTIDKQRITRSDVTSLH